MSSINKIILLGNLGDAPEVRYTSSGEVVANLRLATSETFKDKTGERREQTEWHRVVLFRRLAEIARDYLSKGSKVYIEGRIKTRKWQDRDGQTRYTTEIEADQLKMLDPASTRNAAPTMNAGTTKRESEPDPWKSGKPLEPDDPLRLDDDDYPF